MEFNDAYLIPIITALVSVLKTTGIPTKYSAIVSLVLGIVLVFLLNGMSVMGLLQGVVFGLSASGFYSGTKAIVTK